MTATIQLLVQSVYRASSNHHPACTVLYIGHTSDGGDVIPRYSYCDDLFVDGLGYTRTPDDVTEHSQLTMQRFLEVLSSPDKQLVTSVMSGSQHTVHLLINNICIYAASNLTKFKLIDIYYNPIIHHNMGYKSPLTTEFGLQILTWDIITNWPNISTV